MNLRRLALPIVILAALGALTLSIVFGVFSGVAAARATVSAPHLNTYRVTLYNLTHGQPLSPPVAATSHDGIHEFQVGKLATDQLAAIAQDGNPLPMFTLLNGSSEVTQAVNVGVPLTPAGKIVGSFTDNVTFDIQAKPEDTFSIATMLICTNDGFTGLDRARLPEKGTAAYFLNAYDAGRENNTELSQDIPDPCSALGPVVLRGDPNGNIDTGPGVATIPAQVIQSHPGIQGIGDLSVALHGWTDPVAVVTITRVS